MMLVSLDAKGVRKFKSETQLNRTITTANENYESVQHFRSPF